MFCEINSSPNFSFEDGLSKSSAESEIRHLVNRLRLEFRTATQRQLETAVTAAARGATVYAGDKVFQLARTHLEALLSSNVPESAPPDTEPPFRVAV